MHFPARLGIPVASVLLLLAAPVDADESAPAGPDLVLTHSLKGCSDYKLAPLFTDDGFRVLPEQERPAWYRVGLASRARVDTPSDFPDEISALEASLRVDLLQSYTPWTREPARKAMFDAGLSVPIRVERIEPILPWEWAAWRVVPDFSKITEQGVNHTAVISISAALVHALADAGAKPEDLTIVSDRLDIGPARSPDEVYAREVNDIIQAEEARGWASLQRHAVALLALDCNSVFGHAFLARSLTEQGKQAEAEIEMVRAEALLAERKDARLVAVKEHHPNTRSIEGFMARALCPVHRNATPPRPDDTRCNPGFHYEWGW